MARIRTIKPDFFRHELLQDLENTHPGNNVMLVFAGLWGHCDKAGRFEWKPRTLKLDILPFLNFDMEKTLALLEGAGLLLRYESGGKQYGSVPSFSLHQRIQGKELQEPGKHPAPHGEAQEPNCESPTAFRESHVKNQGSNRESPEITGREGKGREEEGNGMEMAKTVSAGCSAPPRPDPDHVETGQDPAADAPLRLVSDECPHQAILALWAEVLPAARQPRDWPSARQALLRSRWREDRKRQNLEWWRRFFGYIGRSAFLTGKKTGHKNQRPFELGLDWLLESRNFLATIEGKYHEPHEIEQQGEEDAA